MWYIILYFIALAYQSTLVALWVDSKFDIELASELTCPIFNMSLHQPTVYSPLIPCSADIVECVFGVKSDSVQLMLVWERGGGHEGVGQNDDQSRRCPFLLITHYCATDSCQNGSTAEMCTKASINQEGYSSVWSSNPTPHLFLLPVCLTAGCTGQLELRSCQPDCSWNEWMPHSTMTACTFHKILTAAYTEVLIKQIINS